MIKAGTAPALAGCMLAGLFAGCGDKGKENEAGNGEGATVLVITAIPDEKVSDQEARFQALKVYLAGQLGIRVEFSISKDYAAAVQRFANGEVHMAWFGGLTGVQARDRVEGARAHFEIVGLQDHAAALGPELLKRQDQRLKAGALIARGIRHGGGFQRIRV